MDGVEHFDDGGLHRVVEAIRGLQNARRTDEMAAVDFADDLDDVAVKRRELAREVNVKARSPGAAERRLQIRAEYIGEDPRHQLAVAGDDQADRIPRRVLVTRPTEDPGAVGTVDVTLQLQAYPARYVLGRAVQHQLHPGTVCGAADLDGLVFGAGAGSRRRSRAGRSRRRRDRRGGGWRGRWRRRGRQSPGRGTPPWRG